MFYIRFEHIPEDKQSPEYGPYPFVQLTYEQLRVGPDGDWFASFEDNYWEVEDQIYTDVLIFTKD